MKEKKKTGAEHKTGELGELDGDELGRLSNEAWERRRTSGMDSMGGRELKRSRTGIGADQSGSVTSPAGGERPIESGCNLPQEGLDRVTNLGQLGLGSWDWMGLGRQIGTPGRRQSGGKQARNG